MIIIPVSIHIFCILLCVLDVFTDISCGVELVVLNDYYTYKYSYLLYSSLCTGCIHRHILWCRTSPEWLLYLKVFISSVFFSLYVLGVFTDISCGVELVVLNDYYTCKYSYLLYSSLCTGCTYKIKVKYVKNLRRIMESVLENQKEGVRNKDSSASPPPNKIIFPI